MAESTDKRTRQIAEKRVEKGQEFERYQEAQNQLLAIQAEQQQNLAIQRNQAQNVMEQNQTLAQAAEIMALDDLNPQTQQVLSGYGLNQPRVIKNSDVKRQGPTNITINNTTINNTSGPVQGREVSIRPQEASQGRFKAWLTNVFARQDALFQKQNQEYIRRENSLTRNANKMLRKLDGIGKDIGKALDPRKIANTERNRIKTLATIIGIPLLIKYLPKLFDGLNNLSVKITGENGILEKIKKGMDINNKDGWLSKLTYSIYNNDSTGWVNKALQKIQKSLFDRSAYATRGIEGMDWGKPVKKLVKWLELFFGGPEMAVNLERREVENEKLDDLRSDMRLNELNKSLRATEDTRARVDGTSFDLKGSTSRFGISSTDGTLSIVKSKEYKQWLRDNNRRANPASAKEYLDKVKKFAYTGESIILTKRVYDNTKDRVLNSYYDLTNLNTLKLGTNYPDLVTSLEIIHEIKRGYGGGGNIVDKAKRVVAAGGRQIGTATSAPSNIAHFKRPRNNDPMFQWANTMHNSANSETDSSNLIYFIHLLIKKSKITNVLVFPEFVKLLTNQTTESDLKIKKVKIKLIRSRFEEGQQYIYWGESGQGLSDFYKKIVRSDSNSTSADTDPTPVVLPEPDFLNRKDAKEWEVVELNNEQLGTIFERLSGSSEVLYTTEAQGNIERNIISNIQARELDMGRRNTPHFNTTTHERFESAVEERGQYRREREALEEQRRLEKEAKKTANWSNEDSEKYMRSARSGVAQGKDHINYSPDSSSYSVHPTQANLDSAPRVRGGIQGVTQAFGGSGTLTSNFMEYRKDYYYRNGQRRKDGYHYGVDLANEKHGDVLFPGNGVIESIVTDRGMNNRVDVRDDNGYVTRYYHTRAYGGLSVGDRITPGQPIGTTQSKSENNGAFGPHIHVEVHDPEWTESNKHSHYVNPLVYWSENKEDAIRSAIPDITRRSQGPVSNVPAYNPMGTAYNSAANYLGASGEFSGGPNVTPNIERHSPAYNPSSKAVAQRNMDKASKDLYGDERQLILSALGLIADNTAEAAHILRNTDRNVAGIGGSVSKPTPKVSPSVPPIQTNNP